MSVGLLEAVFFPLCSSSLAVVILFWFNHSTTKILISHFHINQIMISVLLAYQGWFEEIHFGLYPSIILDSAADLLVTSVAAG